MRRMPTPITKSIVLFVLSSILLAITLNGCGSVEQRRQKYFERGQQFFKQEKYKEAQIEFQNLGQIHLF